MAQHADARSVRSGPAASPSYLSFHAASTLIAGVERRKLPAVVTDADRQALADVGKCYGRGAYDLPLAPRSMTADVTLDAALDARRSTRDFSSLPVPFEQISAVLAAYRCTGELRIAGGTLVLRTAASAGGLYPIEVYLIATEVTGLPDGVYHYRPNDAALTATRLDTEGDIANTLASLVLDAEQGGRAAGALVLTARFGNSVDKYGERGYRYILIETGHVAQTLALGAEAAGVGLVCHGAFYDSAANRLLGLDGSTEAVTAVLLFGSPSRS